MIIFKRSAISFLVLIGIFVVPWCSGMELGEFTYEDEDEDLAGTLLSNLDENDLNAQDQYGDTILHNAINDNLDALAYTLVIDEKYADIDLNIKNNADKTPLELAAEALKANMVTLLLEAKNAEGGFRCNPNELSSTGEHLLIKLAMMVEAKEKEEEAVKQQQVLDDLLSEEPTLVLDNLPSLDSDETISKYKKMIQLIAPYAISYALYSYNSLPVEEIFSSELLKKLGVTVNITNEKGDTPLHMAVELGEKDFVAMLLKYPDLDINKKNVAQETPFEVALVTNNVEIAQLLLNDERLDTNIMASNENHIILAALAMVQDKTENINKTVEAWRDSYSRLRSEQGPFKKIEELDEVKKIIKMIAVNSFFCAIKKNNLDGLKIIFDNENIKNYYEEVIGEDIQNIINVTFDNKKTGLYLASFLGYKHIVSYLINKEANVDLADDNGQTPLHAAVASNKIDIVELLLKNFANPNAQIKSTGATPLHMAALHWYLKPIVKLLIKSRADINTVDLKGNTALHFAVKEKNIGIVNTLLKAGADKNIKNKEGKTAQDLVEDEGIKNLFQPQAITNLIAITKPIVPSNPVDLNLAKKDPLRQALQLLKLKLLRLAAKLAPVK